MIHIHVKVIIKIKINVLHLKARFTSHDVGHNKTSKRKNKNQEYLSKLAFINVSFPHYLINVYNKKCSNTDHYYFFIFYS